MGGSSNVMPVISKIYCSSSPTTLTVRKRPHVINGGGFVVMNAGHGVVFVVEGCGILGVKGELALKDGDGGLILSISKRGGIAQALSTRRRWNGYLTDFEGRKKSVFSLTDPKCPMSNAIRIHLESSGHSGGGWDFQVNGSFVDRTCTIEDYRGDMVAQLGATDMVGGKELYQVTVQAGYDQAFIVGVLAVLDNIHGESTRC
ncbi:unnamed protein product [Musa textilis]